MVGQESIEKLWGTPNEARMGGWAHHARTSSFQTWTSLESFGRERGLSSKDGTSSSKQCEGYFPHLAKVTKSQERLKAFWRKLRLWCMPSTSAAVCLG